MTRCRFFFALVLLASALALSSACSSDDGSGRMSEEVMRHNILGTAHLGQTKWAEAEAEFRIALATRPDDPLLLTNTAIAVNQQERADEALALLQRAVTADAAYVSAHFNMGLIESRRGNFEQAATHFERAVALDADDLFIRYYLGTSLARVDRETEAIESLRAALQRDPTHVSTLYALGRMLLQQGQQDEGMQMITRSQEIRSRSGLDEAVGSEYGEQGRLSRAADYPGGALEAPQAIAVRFEPGGQVETGVERVAGTVVPTPDGAALLVAGGRSVLELGASEPLTTLELDDAAIVALSAGDANNDGAVDLALLAVVGTTGEDQALTPLWLRQSEAGWQPAGGWSGSPETTLGGGIAGGDLAFVDRDHDGDLDLFWCWTSTDGDGGCKLGTNDGEGRFEVRSSGEHGFEIAAPSPGPVTVAFSDVDNDRDVDLIVAVPTGLHLLTNQRDGNFDDVTETAGLAGTPGAVGALSIADLNKDGWMDLVVAGDGGTRLLVNRNGRFEPPAPLTEGEDDGHGLVVFDLDNDGFLDVASGSVVHHNRGAGRWERRDDLLRAEGLDDDAVPLVDLDADGDGDLDLAVADGNGIVTLLTNQGGNANRWIALASRGIGDNKYGIGAKVELLAGALRQKFEVTAPLPIHAGLGGRESVQAARYLWPSGVLQDEIDLSAGGAIEVAQLDRKGTSCPLLYAWRDGRWRFVTDFLGGAAVGYQQAPGVYSIPDTDEYVRIDGGLTEDGEGRLRLRLNNQLEEVLWFDQVELVVVDHPRGTEVYPDERLMPGPPFPAFELFASEIVREVVSARGVEDGRDLAPALRARDRDYVDNFELLRPKGYAELHTIELDLGRFEQDRRVVLLLDGWIDYADSSANVAAHQAGLKLVPPRLQVADGLGGWRDVGDGVMGFPAGLPKTMTVELTGLFPTPDHRLRIATNMRVYWDRARVMVGGEETPLEVTRLRPLSAELGFGGFPRPVSPDGRKPLVYDPTDVEQTHAWKAHVGQYTGFGDVTPLLEEIDDRFVTTRNGDEIELSFTAPAAIRPGYDRTYLLYADGFGKDMDPNSAANNEIGPIPFHAMPGYPYPADVAPAVLQHTNGLAPRRVAGSPDGLPGALPIASHAD